MVEETPEHIAKDCCLGETEEELSLQTSDEHRVITLQMLNSCRRHMDIVSRDLDPGIYEHKDILDGIKKLALRSRFSRIRILVLEPKTLLSHGHQLIQLSERLTSFIEIRKPGKQHKHYNHALLLVDEYGYIRRQHSDRFEGKANFSDRKTVFGLTNEFEELWEHGLPDPNFRRLNL